MTTPTVTRDPLRSKALAVLREGRLSVLHVSCGAGFVATEVLARVQSSRPGGPGYAVDLLADGSWICTCREQRNCGHIAAVQLVTGHGLRGV